MLRGREIAIDYDSGGTPLQLRFSGGRDRVPGLSVALGEPGAVSLVLLRMPPDEVRAGVDVETWLIPVSSRGEILVREWIPAGYASSHVRSDDRQKLWWDMSHLERVLAPAGVAVCNDVSPVLRSTFDSQLADGLLVNSHGSPLFRGSFLLNCWFVAGFVVMWITALWSITATVIIFGVLIFPVACVGLVSWIAYTTGWLETDPGQDSDSSGAPPWATKLW
ncbi:MAG: hypothetical protein WC054_07070 [Candidatus Nanopelagicales bacterium]